MQNLLSISLIQTDLFWENKEANLLSIEQKLKNVPFQSQIIVLPEMFTTGFSMQPEKWAETMEGETVVAMLSWAKSENKVICGSVMIQENEQYFNRFLWVEPSGKIQFYNKKHLFSYAGEDQHYTAGTEHLIVDYKGWKMACFICYDLRFPEWSRNVKENYDVAIYVANWPEVRNQAWKTLLRARAIENQSFVVGLNRVGDDGVGLKYSGDSVVLNPLGQELAQAGSHKNQIISASLSHQELLDIRQKFPFLKDSSLN